MEQNISYSTGKEGASNLVSLLSESLEPVVYMHNNDCVICSCARRAGEKVNLLREVLPFSSPKTGFALQKLLPTNCFLLS